MNECSPANINELNIVIITRIQEITAKYNAVFLLFSKKNKRLAEKVENSIKVIVSFGSQDQKLLHAN